MKIVSIILVFLLVVVTGLVLTKDMIVKGVVVKGVAMVTGLKLDVAKFKIGLMKSLVDIRELKLYNPPGFTDKVMFHIPEIFVDYDLGEALKGKVYLEDLRLNLKEFVVVKNADGQLNLNSLRVVKTQKQKKAPAQKAQAKTPALQIDHLGLKVGKVIYKDYSRSPYPYVQEFDVNINEEHKNITDPQGLVSLIITKALLKTTISRLANFDLSGLQDIASQSVGKIQVKALEATTKVQEAIQKIPVSEGASKAIEETTEGLKEVFKLPFGSKEE
ncbi:MAG: AsmA family protein [Candidatus Omnitrophota bacterium]